MNSRKFIATLVYSGLVLLLALGICSPRGVAGQLLSGVYKMIETTDLRTQMRVTMHIRLMNAGDDRVFVIQARLRAFLPHGKATDDPLAVISEPHSGSAIHHHTPLP